MPPRKRAGDLTGLETERLQKEHAEELKRRAQEISLMAETEAELSEIPVDYSDGPNTKASNVYDLEVEEVELQTPTRTVIPNADLESVTFGAGNHYTFEAGKKYTVPKALADHLSSKGLLWESPR